MVTDLFLIIWGWGLSFILFVQSYDFSQVNKPRKLRYREHRMRIDYKWLWDLMVENPLQLGELFLGRESLSLSMNSDIPQFDHWEVVRIIDDEVRKGNIAIEMLSSSHRIDGNVEVKELCLIPEFRRRIKLALTFRGGMEWESYSHPAWDKYVTASSWTIEPQGTAKSVVWIEGGSKSVVEQVYGEISIQKDGIIHGTRLDGCSKPWRVTYWKTLPIGYAVEYMSEEEIAFSEKIELPEFNKWHK